MNLYILVWEDRHSDTGVYAFSDLEKAISTARSIAKKYVGDADDYQERDYNDNWLFYAEYSCERDHVRVEVVELDKGIKV